MRLATPSWFKGMPLKLKETNISTKYNIGLRNPTGKWREAHQLAFHNHDRDEELN